MKKIYHLCLSAGNEIMFRDAEDYNKAFNYFAIALHKTDSSGLVEAFMSTHCHMLVRTSDPKAFMFHLRNSYSKYFNYKYKRCGKLGEAKHFTCEIKGHHHILAAASYILRNPLHHGVAPIPYSYPHCSVNAIFRTEMGRPKEHRLLPQKKFYKHIGKDAEYPDRYQMHESGVFLRESVLDIPYIENLYMTPRSFNYYMSRKSSEQWELEQSKDKNDLPPITLTEIESNVSIHTPEQMHIWENGREDYKRLSDIELCYEIDRLVYQHYEKKSIYLLTHSEKLVLANALYKNFHLGKAQICRGLVLNDL